MTTVTQWLNRIENEQKVRKTWRDKGEKIQKMYRNFEAMPEKMDMNILYSNTEILKASVYPSVPKPDVRRRYLDKDPVARQVSMLLERALKTSLDSYDFDGLSNMMTQDWLLTGLGQMRLRYTPYVGKNKITVVEEGALNEDGTPFTGDTDEIEKDGDEMFVETLEHEECMFELVPWDRFGWEPVAQWEDVKWCYIEHLMDKEDLENADFAEMPEMSVKLNGKKFARVYEVFDKSNREITVVSRGAKEFLKKSPDPMELENFFPFPKPLFGIQTSADSTPVPEYLQYQEQALALETVVERLTGLTEMLKVAGVYDSAFESLVDVMRKDDGEFIPVEGFSKLIEKGGIKAVVDTLDLDEIAGVIVGLENRKESLKADIFEITGISDIVRGASKASETLGAQQIKSQGFNLRIEKRRTKLQNFLRDLFELKSEVYSEVFDTQTLERMTGIQVTPEMDQLLRSDESRDFRVNVETDQTLAVDVAEEQKNRIEFTDGFIQLLEKVIPAVQSGTITEDFFKQLIHFTIAPFKVSRRLEEAIDGIQVQQKQPEPSEAEVKGQLEQQKMQQDAQLEQAKLQMEAQAQQFSQQLETQQAAFDAQLEEKKVTEQLAIALKKVLGELEIKRTANIRQS